MRYGNPSTKSKVRELVEKGCDKIVFLPLYPQYAGATSATACDQVFRALMEERWQPSVRTVPAYFESPSYIDALAKSVEKAYAEIDWAAGEWITDDETGEQMWQPAAGGEAISSVEWEQMVAANGDDAPAADGDAAASDEEE